MVTPKSKMALCYEKEDIPPIKSVAFVFFALFFKVNFEFELATLCLQPLTIDS